MENGWTPGPWESRYVSSDIGTVLAIVEPDKVAGDAICFVTDKHSWSETDEANANLIAAAPMLHDGCEDALEALKLLRIGLIIKAPEVIELIDSHIDELSYALVKARGE